MVSSLKDPIRKKVILIVLLSLTSLMLLTFSHQFVFKKYMGNLEKEIDNQISKREIGELIAKKINESHLKITHLIKSSNPLSYDIYKQENAKICHQIYELLLILQNGGEYKYKYHLNLAKRDLADKIITYKKPANEGIVLEAIDLFPQIKMIEDSFNEILDVKERSSKSKSAEAKKYLNNEAIYKEMMLHTAYERSLENISRITYEVEQKISQMKNYREKLRVANMYYSFLLLLIISIIIIIVSYVLNRQIKIIQKENEENAERFRAFSEATSEGLIFLENEKVFDMNKKVTDITGYSLKEIQNYEKADFINLEDKKRIMLSITSYSDDPCDIIAKRKDGKRIDVEFRGKFFHYKNRLIQVVSIKDITERKKAEQALIDSEKHLKLSQKTAHLGHWELDLLRNVLIWSDEVYRIFNIDHKDFNATYEDFINSVHPDDRQKVEKAYSDSLINKTPYKIEHRILTKSGDIKYVLEQCSTDFDEEGKPLKSFGTVLDITERKKIEQDLIKSEEKLKIEKERLKMLNKIIRHDLSNDFIAINSAVNIYKSTANKSMLDEIINRVSQSLATIKNYRKYETFLGSNQNLVIIDIKQLLETIIPKFSQINFNITGNCKVYADDALRSVFSNLISNSIHHGKSNEITINISSNNNICEIEYSDNGTGIPDKIKNKIFDEGFHYGKSGNTGIGLFIVEKTISLYKGSISVIDNQTEGAHFLIKLNKAISS